MPSRCAVLIVLAACAAAAVSTAPAAATFPGVNGKIAFDTNSGEILSMNPDGSGQANLTNSGSTFDGNPAWSPDGRRIAFNSGGDVWVMDADGANPVNLTPDTPSSDDGEPAWSPDGAKIAFVSTRDGGDYEVYVMDANGSGATNISNTAGIDAGPAWSPDGAKIAFFSNRGTVPPNSQSDVYVMDANGANQVDLTNNAADEDSPDWSPDGKTIAFNRRAFGFHTEIWALEFATPSNVTNLTNNSAEDSGPAYSPDGTSIAFASSRDGNLNIYTMDANGSNQTPRTSDAEPESHPSWGVPTPAKPVVTPPVTSGPANLDLRASLVRVNRRGRGSLPATCNNLATDACDVALTLKMRRPRARAAARRRIRVGTVRGHLAGATTGKLALRLNRRGRMLLRKHNRLRVSAAGTSRNNAREPTTVRATLRIKPKRRRR